MQRFSSLSDRPRRRHEDLALGWLLGTDPGARPSLARLAGEAAGFNRSRTLPPVGAASPRDLHAGSSEAALPDAWIRLWRRSLLPEQLIAYHEDLARTTEEEAICDTLARHAALIVGAYQAVVLLPHADADERVLGVAGWWSYGAPPPELHLHEEIAADAPRLIDPAAVNVEYAACHGLSLLALTPGIATLALVPVGQRGLLLLSERRDERIFTPDDWTVLEALASHADRALASAAALAEARTAALEDPLTGLANRRHLEAVLQHAWSAALRGEGLTVILLDLDDFKGINDQFGHTTGDDVLRVVGEVLRTETRGADAVVRYGGDEFLIVLPRADATGARNLFARIRSRLDGWVGVSAGIAEYHASFAAPGDLIDAADAELYSQKRRQQRTGDRQ